LTRPAYVNVFMGRLNAFVSNHGLGPGENVGEKTTLATQQELIAMRNQGRTETRLIGASIRDGSQIADLAGLDVFTMPPKAAAQFREKPPADLVSRVDEDLPITLSDGVSLDDFGGRTLWEVPEDFKMQADALAAQPVDGLQPEDIRAHFRDAGWPGFLPAWTGEDIREASKSKIPEYGHWKDRLRSGEVGLDAVMNLCALRAFTKDQQAMDERVRSMLNG